MLPQSSKFSHSLCLNNFLQVLLIGNQIYQVPQFRYINRGDEVSHLVRVRKVLGSCLLKSSRGPNSIDFVGIT